MSKKDHWWNTFVAVPFKEHGRDINGCDCWGLVRLVYKEQLDIWLPDRLDYENTKAFDQTSALVSTYKASGYWKEIPKGQQQDYDVVVLKINSLPCHVGVVCDGGKSFLHVIEGANSVIDRLSGLRWGGRIDSYWRFAA